ncbi:sporulation protein YunB [Bacillus salitolerans]|uniref:Sporulation protein YunB n=1 Tax=Bacillus salitolerans TaxID=1437434 RepID=A0ABW4LSV0_9BACI
MVKFRGKKPRRGPLPFRYVFLLSFVIFTFSTAIGLWIVNKGIEPTLIAYAESKTEQIATLVINKAINQKIAEDMDINELIITELDADGNVSLIKFNPSIVTRVLSETTNVVQRSLNEVADGNLSALEFISDIEIETSEQAKSRGITYEIPLGQATNNALLGNLGPKVPIRFMPIGEVSSDIVTSTEEFGINNAWLEVAVKIKVNVQIIVPFATKQKTVTTEIPIGMAVLPGQVPEFYNGAGGEGVSPSIEISP